MTFDIELGGRPRSVSVEKAGREGRYRVIVDGQARDVDARRAGPNTLLVSVAAHPPKVPGLSADKSRQEEGLARTYEVGVTPSRNAGDVLVTLGGRTAVVTVNGHRRGRASDTARHAPGERAIVAPMPGRVVRILVAVGDEVAPGQGVVVVEAMKMENELRAPAAGRVKDVTVTPGTSVEAGRVLVVIE